MTLSISRSQVRLAPPGSHRWAIARPSRFAVAPDAFLDVLGWGEGSRMPLRVASRACRSSDLLEGVVDPGCECKSSKEPVRRTCHDCGAVVALGQRQDPARPRHSAPVAGCPVICCPCLLLTHVCGVNLDGRHDGGGQVDSVLRLVARMRSALFCCAMRLQIPGRIPCPPDLV